MVAETRFAQSPSGPIAYRYDSAGAGRWLVVVPDRANPYGAGGEAAYDAFADALMQRGWQLLTLLDGRGPGAAQEAVGTDRRIAAVQAVAAEAGVSQATVLGVGAGAAPAAMAVAADPTWSSRLILFGSFTGDVERGTWAATSPDQSGPSLPPIPMDAKEREDLVSDLEEARESIREARELWSRLGGPGLADRLPRQGRLAGLRELVQRPDRWEGGLDELIRNVTQLERGDDLIELDALGHITVPTVVADTSGDPDSAGLGIAARIPAARHRAVSGEPDPPWTDAGPAPALLALLDEGQPAKPPPPPAGEARPPQGRVLVTLLFTDIVASTERLAEVGDAAWRDLLERHHAIVRGDLTRFGGSEIDNAGDGFLASFPTPAPAIRCALSAITELAAIGLGIRCGLHTGECEQIAGKLGGITVHIGARIAAQAGAGEVLVSGTVHDLVAGAGVAFDDRGAAELKGLPGMWSIYAVTGI